MKSIQLTSPAYLNGGAYASTGDVVEVGDGKDQITAERADDIVKGERAVVDDEKPAKGGASK
jgi:hypothetical protein